MKSILQCFRYAFLSNDDDSNHDRSRQTHGSGSLSSNSNNSPANLFKWNNDREEEEVVGDSLRSVGDDGIDIC